MGYLSQRSIVEIISNPFEIIEKTNLSSEIFSHPFGSKISYWNFQNWFQIILPRLFLEQQTAPPPKSPMSKSLSDVMLEYETVVVFLLWFWMP